MVYLKTITNEELQDMPLAKYQGEAIIVNSQNEQEAVEYLSNCSVIGFDTETRPSFSKGISYKTSLLQLSGSDKTFLFRLMHAKLPNGILRILRSSSILKIGVDIKQDIKQLNEITRFTPKGFIDLQTIAPSYGIEEKSLRKLTAIVLGQKLSKAKRLSNWEAGHLTESQISYAATDSWVSREIYVRMVKGES